MVQGAAGGPGVKVETTELAARVERLELEAREYEARVRLIEGRARLESLRAAKKKA